MRKKLLICLLILLFVGNTSALFIGTSPGIGEHGTLERGETYQFQVAILTDASTNFTIRPEISEPSRDFYAVDGQEDTYEFNERMASREDISDWVSFTEDSYTIDPSREIEGTNAQGMITYFIDVPRTAEPGYHAAEIRLNNDLNSRRGGTVQTMGISEYKFIFQVPGNVEKDLEVSNFEGLRSGDDQALLQMDVTNTGSVTVMLEMLNSSIYSQNGERMKLLVNHPYEKIAPGETKTIESRWYNGNDIRAGNYRMRGSMEYITGTAFLDNSFQIENFIEIEPSNNSQGGSGNIIPSGESGESPPTMLILIFLVLSGALMYAFEIDPLLIIMVLGMISISSFIWFAGLPLYLVGLVIITSAGVFYYGWM